MKAIYVQANINPVEVAARLKLAIALLQPLLQYCEPHSVEDRELQGTIQRMQHELDTALNAATYEVRKQQDAGLITFEQFVKELGDVSHQLNSYYIARE